MNFRQPNEDLFEQSRMTFGEHLEDLRKTLVKCLITVGICSIFGFLLANQVVSILTQPLVNAIGEYDRKESVEELIESTGYVDPELRPWLETEKYVVRRMRVEPAQLVRALQTLVPEFAEKVDLDPNAFFARNFDQQRLPGLCVQWSTQKILNQKSPSQPLVASTKFLWETLTPDEQATVTQIAQKDTASAEDVSAVVRIFNRLSSLDDLSDAPAFKAQVQEPEKGLFDFLSKKEELPLVHMKAHLDETKDSEIARKLNRALLTDVFSSHMPELKADLVPFEFWERSVFEPQSLGVSEGFMVWVKAGVLTGLIFAGPFVFYYLWTFVASGLYPHEQKYVHVFLPISIALFVSGVLLAFFFVFQPVLGFLFSFNRQMGIAPQMRINDWLSFVMFLPLGFGVAFQLPLVMLFMNRIGLFQVSDYLSKWRIAVMIIFVLSMILTPADPISMLLLAIPLTGLYFLGIGMCQWMPKKQNPFGEEEHQYQTE